MKIPWQSMRKELGVFVLLLVLFVGVALKDSHFLTEFNLQNLAGRIGRYGIFSIGLGFVIITGGIDLSVGSAMALLGVLFSILLDTMHVPAPIGIVIMLAGGAVLGVLHGLLITRAKMQPFIVTLCGLLLYRGMARYFANDSSRGFTESPSFQAVKAWGNATILKVPTQLWLLFFVAVIAWFILHRSVYGRHLFAVGSNEQAARYSGIDTNRVIMWAYIICGVLTALSGLLFLFDSPSITPDSHATFFELYGIAAAVIGGCSLRGGEGSLVGIVLGVTLLPLLRNIVNLLGISSSLEFAVLGAVILFGVLADQLLKNMSARRA
jgi:ribose transport system permease protein